MLRMSQWIVLVILTALLACGEQAATPREAVATVPASAGDATSAPSPVTRAPMQTETPEATPTETTVPGAATTPLPANTQAPEGTEAPLSATSEPETLPPGDVITPLNLDDPEAALSRLSKPEISCLEQAAGPGRLHEILRDARVPVQEEEAWLNGCCHSRR